MAAADLGAVVRPPAPAIVAHRGLVAGPDKARENAAATLRGAVAQGFSVEFDVRDDRGRLVLSHDPGEWSEERDAARFLADPGDGVHALNVKSLEALDTLLDGIARAGTAASFFLFDFELLGGTPELMRSVQERGFAVAHRLSDREPFLDDYVDAAHVTHVWLDEWETPWVTGEVVRALAAAGKQTFYVSPELHRPLGPDDLAPRWSEVAEWGVTGICTDYPLRLRELLGGNP